MKTLLICHAGSPLDREALARWLASFSELTGIVELRERRSRLLTRISREIRRSGWLRFLDVVAFRIFYRVFLAARDQKEERLTLERLNGALPPVPATLPVLTTPSPNSAEAAAFISRLQPDMVIARCKVILRKEIFSIAKQGTFVLHPGICPEYRNAHGCFWALARNDAANVGLTLLRVDEGVDTGPVHGYFRCAFDERKDSHIAIQYRVLFANLDGLREKLLDIAAGKSQPIPTEGRKSAVWGQPWLTRYLAWKRRARRTP